MWGHPFYQGIIPIVRWVPPHFTGLEYSGASVRGHTYFPVVQCIGLQYSVLDQSVPWDYKNKVQVIGKYEKEG